MKTPEYSRLIKAILCLLRPIVRILIRNEVSHSEFAELGRQAYVQEAYQNFAIPGRKMTYARVSVLTGLNRKEVVRLNNLDKNHSNGLQAQPNRAIRVINGWLTDNEFSESGKARVLPLNGETACFRALVDRYSGDISMGAVLDELKRVGVVEMPDKGCVKLIATGYIPKDDLLEKIEILSISVADLLNTAIYNLELNGGKSKFQRQLVYHKVPPDIAAAFEVISERDSHELLQRLNSYLSEQLDREAPGNDDDRRVGIGIYFIDNQ